MSSNASAVRVLDRVKASLAQSDLPPSSFLSPATASRYLRGYFTEVKAAKYMLATYNYRCRVRADDLGIADDTYKLVWRELRKRSMYLAALSDGDAPPSPVLIMRKKGEAFVKEDFEEYRRAFFFILECTAQLADRGVGKKGEDEQTGQWVIVMDMQGYSTKNSPPLSVSRETLNIFQHHFPERAKRVVILDAPFGFGMLWKMLRPMIDAVTKEKFLFLSRTSGERALREALGEEVQNALEIDLETGKQASANLMVESGFLRAQE